jgi:hypothetical protein
MHSLWLLPAVALAVPVYYVWHIRRSGKHEPRGGAPSGSQPSAPVEAMPESTGPQTRMMRWISISEFMTVLASCSDLIVIDLRADAQLVPFPVPTAFVLPVAPKELINVLEWLPADRTAVFCGASNVSIFLITTGPCMEGSAPFYVLEGDLSSAEVV